jgi:hypothetical protein
LGVGLSLNSFRDTRFSHHHNKTANHPGIEPNDWPKTLGVIMAHPKVVTPILPRSNNQPKTKSNRIAAIVRSVEDGFFDPDDNTVVGTLQHVMRVLDDCQHPHREPVRLEIEDCPLCFAMRQCAAELITLKNRADETLEQLGGAL